MAAKVKTKSRTASQLRTSMIIFIIVAILALGGSIAYTVANWNYMIKGETVDLNEALRNNTFPEKGEHVTFRCYFVFGNFAETKHTINGFIPAGTEQHYAVMMDDYSVMAVTVKSKSDINRLEELMNQNWDYAESDNSAWLTNYIDLEGSIKSMNREIEGFYNDALRKADITTEYYSQIRKLTIDTTDTRLSYFGVAGFLLLICIIFVILCISNRKQMKQLKQLQSIARENAADPSLNPFLNQNAQTENPADPAAGQNPFLGAAAGAYAANNAAGGYADPNAIAGYADPNAANGYADPNAYAANNTAGGYADQSAYDANNAAGGYADPNTYAANNTADGYADPSAYTADNNSPDQPQ